MKNLTNDEVNKIIADFMGIHPETFLTYNIVAYTKSLDRQIPVWEKLGANLPSFLRRFNGNVLCHFMGWEVEEETIQEAAAHATCLAIMEINKNE